MTCPGRGGNEYGEKPEVSKLEQIVALCPWLKLVTVKSCLYKHWQSGELVLHSSCGLKVLFDVKVLKQWGDKLQ